MAREPVAYADNALRGTPRLRRHLWRMCAALFIATGSFFLGQAQVFPAPIRDSGLLPVPVLVVLGAMLYWLWRVRTRRTVNSGPPEGRQSTGVYG